MLPLHFAGLNVLCRTQGVHFDASRKNLPFSTLGGHRLRRPTNERSRIRQAVEAEK